MEDELLTYQQLAQLLNTKVATLYALVSQRRIPHVRLGKRFVRFPRSAIEAWLVQQAVSPTENVPKAIGCSSAA